MAEIASFSVTYSSHLGPDGRLTGKLPACFDGYGDLLPLYRNMVLTRQFDAKCIALQRTGRLGTYPSCLGQEAIGAGVGSAMRVHDVLVPTYREHGAQIFRGTTIEELLLYWGGDERGSDFSGPREDFPVCIPIATQCTHAAGVAAAFKIRNQPRVAVVMCGDGGTSKGDFSEAVNIAGAWTLPMVFIVSNNQWAISVPRSEQTGAKTLAQKAIAGGIRGEQVDGNDALAVRDTVGQALERARSGNGATLVECVTYRLGDHTTADDASRYRSDEALQAARGRDPIDRLRTLLQAEASWSDEQDSALRSEVDDALESAVARYLASPAMPPTSMFDSLYAELPRALVEQRAEAERWGGNDE